MAGIEDLKNEVPLMFPDEPQSWEVMYKKASPEKKKRMMKYLEEIVYGNEKEDIPPMSITDIEKALYYGTDRLSSEEQRLYDKGDPEITAFQEYLSREHGNRPHDKLPGFGTKERAVYETDPGGLFGERYETGEHYNKGGRIGYASGTRNRMSELMIKLANGTITDEEMIELRNIESASDFSRANHAQGGRTGYQTGGVTESRQLPPDWVEALGKTYAADLTKQAGIPSITTATAQQPGETAQQWQQRQAQAQQFGITKAGMAELAPQVAAQDPYQAAAYAQAVDPTKGLGGYQPYLTAAGTAAGAAGALTGTGAGTGAGSIQSYMSPYQQQVIDTTMADYDAQAAKSRLGLGAQAVSGGAFGSGRHGIAESEFDALSNRGRASQLANLRQTGFGEAAQRRQQDLSNQMGLSNLQSGLGGTQQDFARAQIAGLGTLGAGQQAQNQAILDAQRQASTMAVQDPINRMNMLGSGVTGLMGGMGQITTEVGQQAPQSSPLGTALGVGLAGADIYSRLLRNRNN